MKRGPLVLFDVDGTLVNAAGAGRWALERAFESVFGFDALPDAATRVRFDGRTDPLIIEEIAALAGIEAGILEGRARDLERRYLDELAGRLAERREARALPGVRDLLVEMTERRAPFGLLTGNIERGARLKLGAVGIGTFFTLGAFGSDGPHRAALGRLARERFETALDRSFAPEEVVVVGDSVEDVRAARANGYRCLAVLTGWTEREILLSENPDALIQDLSSTTDVLDWFEGSRSET